MPNGKHGDHPLTDLLVHGLDVYSPEADALIRDIARFVALERLRALHDWIHPGDPGDFVAALRRTRDGLVDDARRRGWDVGAEFPGVVALADLLRDLEALARDGARGEVFVPDRVLLHPGLPVPGPDVLPILEEKAATLGLDPAGAAPGDGGTALRFRRRAV